MGMKIKKRMSLLVASSSSLSPFHYHTSEALAVKFGDKSLSCNPIYKIINNTILFFTAIFVLAYK
jgi:hypothetical protein